MSGVFHPSVLKRIAVLLISVVAVSAADASEQHQPPERIVSLNLCTDQLLMMLVDEKRIAAVSNFARDPKQSVMADVAKRIPINHGRAEELYLLEPDLVLAGTFSSRTTVEMLRRLGLRVEEFAPAISLSDVAGNLRRMGALTGTMTKAEGLIADFEAEAEELGASQPQRRPVAAFYHSNSYTSGEGTLYDEVLRAAGFDNLAARAGIRSTAKISLEALVLGQPDLVIRGQSYDAPALADDVLRHPALDFVARRAGDVAISDKFTTCGTPQTVDAIAQLVAARERLASDGPAEAR